MVTMKRNILYLAVVGFFSLASTAIDLSAAVDKKLPIIVLDPGHGGKDGGGIANGLKESEVTLTMTKELARKLERRGYKVVLTRNVDKAMLLTERAAIEQKFEPALFLSLHTGWSKDVDERGVAVFHSKLKEGEKRNELAGLLAKDLGDAQPKVDAKVREARVSAFGFDDWLLLELGMLSNKKDAELLSDNLERNKLLETVAETIDNHLSE